MKKFRFSISGESILGIKDIWPAGNPPENPTIEDVERVLAKYRSIDQLLSDWNLEDDFAWKISEVDEDE